MTVASCRMNGGNLGPLLPEEKSGAKRLFLRLLAASLLHKKQLKCYSLCLLDKLSTHIQRSSLPHFLPLPFALCIHSNLLMGMLINCLC